MTLSPAWRTRLFTIAGVLLAVVLGVQIAQESLFWPYLCGGVLAAFILTRTQSLPLGTVLLGIVLVGYIAGNRGFAQISLTGTFPLLPAEFVLLVAMSIMTVQSALRRELPLRRDALNVMLLLWMVIGTIRLLVGIRGYGIAAIRDYALVYYAGFFFLAQHAASDPAAARFLRRSLLVGCGLLLIIHPLYSQMPDFFLSTLSIRGVPLVFYKDDLAGNFMAMGCLLFFGRYEQSKNLGSLVASLGLAALMVTTNSRSSIVGLAVGAAWLALGRRWRFAATLAVSGAVAAVAILLAAYLRNQPWQKTPLYSVYERGMSILDPLGQRAYQSDDTFFKGDNNVFRMVWWRVSVQETWETKRWFGLGFGHDLAQQFVREYFPENEDFTARSPHNVLITVFARMGIIGFAAFLGVIIVIAIRTWKVLWQPAPDPMACMFWCAAWVVLVCACFGVVLEGPMGAVVFWTVLGMANATSDEPGATPASADEEGQPNSRPTGNALPDADGQQIPVALQIGDSSS